MEKINYTPEIFIRKDGKGFIVRKWGFDWLVFEGRGGWFAERENYAGLGEGETIMGAVNNGFEKLGVVINSPQKDK